MTIAAASDALALHLRSRLQAAGALEGWAVEARTLRDARAGTDKLVALVLWRVQPDEPSDDSNAPLRAASQADPPEGTGLKLRYLLLVRGAPAADEQRMLGYCMAALDRNPVVADTSAPSGRSTEALVVAVETPPDEAYLRLVGLCGDPPPLVVPYVARTIPLNPLPAGGEPDRPDAAAP
jgi:Pvc16 N-terminal domain